MCGLGGPPCFLRSLLLSWWYWAHSGWRALPEWWRCLMFSGTPELHLCFSEMLNWCGSKLTHSLCEQTNFFSGKKCLTQGYMDFSSASFPPLPAENTVFSYLQHFSKFHAWFLTQCFRPGETRFECRSSWPDPVKELVAGPTCICRGRGAGQAEAAWNDCRYLVLPLPWV